MPRHLVGMSTSWDESAVLEDARATFVANRSYMTIESCRAFIGACRTLLIFPEQATLPGGGEMFRFNHSEIGKMLRQAEIFLSNRQGASAQLTHVRLCGRDGR